MQIRALRVRRTKGLIARSVACRKGSPRSRGRVRGDRKETIMAQQQSLPVGRRCNLTRDPDIGEKYGKRLSAMGGRGVGWAGRVDRIVKLAGWRR